MASVGSLAGGAGIVLAAFALFAGTASASLWQFFTADLPAAHDLATVPVPLSTLIYDRTGEHLLYRLEDERRELIGLEQVPELLQQATVAIEDRTFWTNPGVDVSGILRAAEANMRSGEISQGGSTITQQLIKTRLLGDEPTFTRKIKEAILALEATRLYPKEQILEMYFNQIYYGNQAYGIKAAAATYFSVTDLSQLTLGQMALLAGLPQLPSAYDPVQDPAAAKLRRADVLQAMVDNGYVTAEQAAAAKAEPIEVKQVETAIAAPHFVFRLREQLGAMFGERAAYQGGYKVLSSLDWDLQQLAEAEVKASITRLKRSNVNNAGLITMDPKTAEILAYVGSVDYYDRSPQVQGDYDSAGIAMRQPGSTFKIFTYLAGMQKLGLTAASILNDIEFKMDDGSGTAYAPKNAPSGGFSVQNGPLSLRQSLRESLNLPALSVGRMVGVDSIMDMVAQLGIRRDWGDRARYGLSFAIGAGELRLIDMASAYQVVANMGVRVEPTFIHQVIGPDGIIVKDFSKPESRRVLDEATAWVFADILKDNTDPQGSWLFGPWTNIGRKAALKTGTTDNLQDVLAIGFTPQRLTAIWMGNADNSIMYGITSAMGPGVLWRDYMKKAMADLPEEWYERPENVVQKIVCVNPTLRGGNGSGKLPGPGCPRSFRRNEFFVAGTEPKTDDRGIYLTGRAAAPPAEASPGASPVVAASGSCYKLVAHFPEWQKFANSWAASASKLSGGRFGSSFCGIAPAQPSGSPSASPGASGPPGQGSPPASQAPPTAAPTPQPTPQPTPKPTKKP